MMDTNYGYEFGIMEKVLKHRTALKMGSLAARAPDRRSLIF